ncbi:hypothetical protein ACEZCY_24730 [Streptacidiphilus sp. N1-12]|uniref:Uncharacterized protein n=2 Tax=Streptacidiphilus alkalitolerans TaxID=3342712 RepID=A0ABV6WK31_9ACTN
MSVANLQAQEPNPRVMPDSAQTFRVKVPLNDLLQVLEDIAEVER